jgi:hypothetical protein
MATTQQVMATTPVLNSPKDWYQWYIALENFADAKGIWDYVNPESKEDELLELQEPTLPNIQDACKTGSTRRECFADLDADERDTYYYKYLERRYHDERVDFGQLQDALEKLVEHLFRTVNSRYMTISLGGKSLGRDPKKIYNLLKKLRKRLL